MFQYILSLLPTLNKKKKKIKILKLMHNYALVFTSIPKNIIYGIYSLVKTFLKVEFTNGTDKCSPILILNYIPGGGGGVVKALVHLIVICCELNISDLP